MMSAVESIIFNIVEGCGANSKREFARFLDISIKSTMELESQLQLAHDYGILHHREWLNLTRETIEIRKMLCAYRRKLLEDDSDAA